MDALAKVPPDVVAAALPSIMPSDGCGLSTVLAVWRNKTNGQRHSGQKQQNEISIFSCAKSVSCMRPYSRTSRRRRFGGTKPTRQPRTSRSIPPQILDRKGSNRHKHPCSAGSSEPARFVAAPGGSTPEFPQQLIKSRSKEADPGPRV